MPVINEVMLSPEWNLLQMAGNTTHLTVSCIQLRFFLLLAARGCKLWFDWHTHAACATFVVYTEESLVRLVGVQTVKLWSAQWYRCRGICAYLRTKVKAKLKWYEITLKIFSPLKKKKKKNVIKIYNHIKKRKINLRFFHISSQTVALNLLTSLCKK